MMDWRACAVLLLVGFLSSGIRAQEERCLLDVALVIDHSGSIRDRGVQNWGLVIGFVKEIVSALNIGEHLTHMAAVSFGNRATLDFTLNQYLQRDPMIAAVERIRNRGGNTNTTGGLRLMRTAVFTPSGGDRPSVPNLCILITDGMPTREVDKLAAEVRLIKSLGIRIMAVGVTNRVNETLLRSVVTAPSSAHYFFVTDFNELRNNLDKLIAAACQTVTTPRPSTTATTITPSDAVCRSRGDMVFVVDASGSIGSAHYQLVKRFVAGIVRDLDLEGGDQRVGVVTFADHERLRFHLNKYQNREEAVRAIEEMDYTHGTTNTAAALKYVRESMFRADRGARTGVPHIVVVLTDGGSNDKARTQQEAYRLRNAGVHVIVIALGDWLDHMELMNMASYPHKRYLKYVEDFETLDSIKADIRDLMCNRVNECQSNPCRNGDCVDGLNMYWCRCRQGWAGHNCDIRCRVPADIVFALDASGSVGWRNFQKQVDFVRTVVNGLNLNGESRVGVQSFANQPTVRFHLNAFSDRYSVLDAMTFHYSGGTTNTAAAIRTMRTEMFTSSRGDRGGVPNVGVVLTDGRSNEPRRTWAEAMLTRQAGIDLIAVGIGPNVRRAELVAMASAPTDRNVISVAGFDSLDASHDALLATICNAVDDCISRPCRNGGSCIDLRNGYSCHCQENYSGKNCERRCDGKLDLIFVIDRSGSIRHERFPEVLDFIATMIDKYEVSATRTRIGVVAFSNDAQVEFHLNKYTTKQDVIQHVRHIIFTGGRTHTSSAIRIMKDDMFRASRGDRADVQNVAVIVTDGNSNVRADRTVPDAIEARVSGVHIVVVAVGTSLNTLELRGIASQPTADTLLTVDRIRDLPQLTARLDRATCNDGSGCSGSNPCRNGGQCIDVMRSYWCQCRSPYSGQTCERRCTRQLDVAFVLDLSGSVDVVYDIAIRFVRAVVYGLPVSSDRARIALVTFSDEAKVEWDLNTYQSKVEMLNALSFRRAGGRTNTQRALRLLNDDVFSSSRGDRSGVPNVAIVVSDGESNVRRENTQPEARRARQRAVEIYSLAIGERPAMDELNGMATEPHAEHVLRARTEADVENAAARLLDELCQA